jgi:hypothetical protein
MIEYSYTLLIPQNKKTSYHVATVGGNRMNQHTRDTHNAPARVERAPFSDGELNVLSS